MSGSNGFGEVDSFVLTLDGRPQGKPRARYRPGQKPYPDRRQKLAEGEIRRVWREAGSPRLPDAPVELRIALRVTRPAGHFKRDGSLSAEGLRNPWPHRVKPDLDNAIKLVCDALNGLAWRDDVRVVFVSCHRLWAEWPSTWLRVSITEGVRKET
jgi:Holliday junction resolvase RusA-like endonuclease